MNLLYKKVSLKVHPYPFFYNVSVRTHRCTVDRDQAFIRIRDEILEDPEFQHLAVQWAGDDLVIKRMWRTIRSKYCPLQLQLINEDIQEADLTVVQREFLITLTFLEPFVQHNNGKANIGIQVPNARREQLVREALEDFLGDNPELIQQVLAHGRNHRANNGRRIPEPPRAE